jgi:DNA polymerase-3 subunit epsilon
LYAIVDIETTGGSYNDEKITEIAIYRYDGQAIVDQFASLVNPERKIQPFVVKLTGITDAMVKKAPKFQELAKRIVEITEGCILVAHNADFDYRVLRKAFKDLGYDYMRNTLDTVQLSKKLIPDLPSYSLGRLCKSLGIPVANRHRADGDAFATVSLLELLLQKDEEKIIISKSIKDSSIALKKEKLATAIKETPAKTGVFYIHQSNGRIMYIGKGKNMRSKLSQLLAKKSKKALSIQSKLARVSHDESGNYVMARLIFNQKVATHKPRYNSNYYHLAKPVNFNHPNMILIGQGRKTGEKSIVLIENDSLNGYTYIDLEYQITNIEILKNLLTPLDDSLDNRYIVKTSLLKNRIEKIIRL